VIAGNRRPVAEMVRENIKLQGQQDLKQSKMSATTGAESLLPERPVRLGPGRLAEGINPTGTRKVH